MHITALKGRIGLFVYFHSLGLSHEEVDINSRKPLHLAAMEGQELVCLLIIA